MAKTTCPITRNRFLSKATSIQATIGGTTIPAMAAKQFSTGSMGWGASTKVTLVVDGIPLVCQVGLNITVVGSKELPGAVPEGWDKVDGGVVSDAPTPAVQAIIAANRAAKELPALQVA